MQRSLLALLALTAACGTTRLAKSASGWRLDGAAYQIDALPDGEPMPDGWTLKNFRRVGGSYEKIDRDRTDAVFTRVKDDGSLLIASAALTEGDEKKAIRVLLDRVVSASQLAVAAISRGGPGGRSIELRPVAPPQTAAADGAEAMAVELEAALIGTADPQQRLWLVVLRPFGQRRMTTLTYANTPSQFQAGFLDAKELLGRLRFDPAPKG